MEHIVPGFRRVGFVDVIQNSAWPEWPAGRKACGPGSGPGGRQVTRMR
ncbi:hypothetical protein [Actinospica acidiphila]|nr:hypothetical protein [Actinospica acidiphila]